MKKLIFLILILVLFSTSVYAENTYFRYADKSETDFGLTSLNGAAGFTDVNNILGRGANREYLIFAGVGVAKLYEVTTQGDPNCHYLSNTPCTDGSDFSPRTFTYVMQWVDSYFAGSKASFHISDGNDGLSAGIYYGPKNTGDIYYWDFDGDYNKSLHISTSGAQDNLAYDKLNQKWWAGDDQSSSRNLYIYESGGWSYQGSSPTSDSDPSNHQDGLAIFGDTLIVAEMTSDILFIYKLDDNGHIIEGSQDALIDCPTCICTGNCILPEKMYAYQTTSHYVENMGTGPNEHLWVTSNYRIYELGGGELQIEMEDEICNNIDDDFDGSTDEGCDDDLDQFADFQMNCEGNFIDGNGSIQQYSTNGNPNFADCDDMRNTVYPQINEQLLYCNDNLDNDCDGDTDCNDSDCTTASNCCPDNDNDRYNLLSCGGTDCNDTNPNINPGVPEICNDGLDNDCNISTPDFCPPECKLQNAWWSENGNAKLTSYPHNATNNTLMYIIIEGDENCTDITNITLNIAEVDCSNFTNCNYNGRHNDDTNLLSIKQKSKPNAFNNYDIAVINWTTELLNDTNTNIEPLGVQNDPEFAFKIEVNWPGSDELIPNDRILRVNWPLSGPQDNYTTIYGNCTCDDPNGCPGGIGIINVTYYENGINISTLEQECFLSEEQVPFMEMISILIFLLIISLYYRKKPQSL